MRRVNFYGKGERNITPYEQVVTDNVIHELVAELEEHLGARLLSERSYAAAALSFARAESGATQKDRAFGLQLYALCMAGQGERARAMAAERAPDITPTAFWRFVGAACQFEVPAK